MITTLFIIPWKFSSYFENLFFYYYYFLFINVYVFIMGISILLIIISYLPLSIQYFDLFHIFWESHIGEMITILILFAPIRGFLGSTDIKRFEFTMLDNNFDNFKKRQKWMNKIFKRVTKRLERGRINISHDDLIRHFNLKVLNSEDVTEYLDDIEKWIVNDMDDADFYSSLTQIIPKAIIKSTKKISYRNIIFSIWDSPNFKYLLLILLFLLKPDILYKILDI